MWRMPKGPGWPPRDNVTNPVLPDLGFDLIPYSDRSSMPTNLLLLFMALTAVSGRANKLEIKSFVTVYPLLLSFSFSHSGS